MITTRTPAGPRRAGRAPGWLLGATLATAAVFGAPLAWLATRALDDAAALPGLYSSARTLRPLGHSLLLGVAVAGCAALVGTTMAWLVARTDLPGRSAARVLLPLPLVLPSFIAAFAFLAAFAPGGLVGELLAPLGVRRLPAVEGFWGALYVLTLFTYPYVYLPVHARLGQLPASLEESSRLLGRGPAATFRTVVLPQAAGAVRAGTLLVFLYVISDFGAVQLLRYDTLTTAIYAARVFDRPSALGQSLLLGALAVVVVTAERAVVRGARPGRLAVGRHLRVRLGRWKAPATALVGLVVGLALIAPVGVLVFWAARGLTAGSTRAGALVADLGALVVPALNTAWLAVLAAAAAALAVAPVAYLTVRHDSRLGGAANAVIVGGFALPGLVIALALTFWTLQAPEALAGTLYQTEVLLVFAYVVHFGSQALRSTQMALAAIPPRLDDAGRTLGARRARRLLTLDLPLALPGMLAGGGLVMLSAMKELPATLLLAPPGFETLATRIWNATEDAFLADASVAALLLVAVSGVLTWALVLRRGEAL